MKKFKIPKKFQLMGNTVTVEYKNDMSANEGSLGEAQCKLNKIYLQDNVKGSSHVDQSIIDQTFFHELVHFILYQMSEESLNNNEEFVTVFSGLLHQAVVTME